jgi:hypothetical protein
VEEIDIMQISVHKNVAFINNVEFVEVLRGKFAENCTGTKAFLLVSVLLRMFDIFLCLSSLNVE